MTPSPPGKVYVVLVNWNGWRDTIECLESVLRSDYAALEVVVCDNGSTDGSLQHITEWAQGRLEASEPDGHPLRHLTWPPIPKPVAYTEYDRSSAEAGGAGTCSRTSLTLIQTGANLGFGGGCNVGLRYALARGDLEFAWLLNHDTVVDLRALAALAARLRARPEAGQCGSRLLFYDDPSSVQALGGAVYNRWLATARHVGVFRPARAPVDADRVERSLDYIVAASVLVSKRFLEEIGLLNEQYFLFYEEIDWVTRARDRFDLAYAHDSIVYHKEGRATGSRSDPARKSVLAEYYGARNRLRFTRMYYPLALPLVWLGLAGSAINRLRRGQPERAVLMLRIMFSRAAYANDS